MLKINRKEIFMDTQITLEFKTGSISQADALDSYENNIFHFTASCTMKLDSLIENMAEVLTGDLVKDSSFNSLLLRLGAIYLNFNDLDGDCTSVHILCQLDDIIGELKELKKESIQIWKDNHCPFEFEQLLVEAVNFREIMSVYFK